MKNIEIGQKILEEIESVFSGIRESEVENLAAAIVSTKRVFVCGTGRSLLMIRGLAMRLMQLGFAAFVVGETTTPSINNGDLLIIGSGSGETETLQVMARKAQQTRAKVAVISISPESTLAKMADIFICLPAATTKSKSNGGVRSIQAGASLFEQCLLILGDILVIRVAELAGLGDFNKLLMKNHANLE